MTDKEFAIKECSAVMRKVGFNIKKIEIDEMQTRTADNGNYLIDVRATAILADGSKVDFINKITRGATSGEEKDQKEGKENSEQKEKNNKIDGQKRKPWWRKMHEKVGF